MTITLAANWLATDSYWRLNMADKYVCIYMWLLVGTMVATGGYSWWPYVNVIDTDGYRRLLVAMVCNWWLYMADHDRWIYVATLYIGL